MLLVRLLLPICLAPILLSQQPAPSAGKASSPPKKSAEQVEKQSKDNGNTPDKGMTVNFFSNAPDSESKTGNSGANENKTSSTDRWLTGFTGALVFVGAVQGIILGFQYRWMRRNTEALIHMQRARIGVSVEFEYDVGRKAVFYNYGQTPASVVYVFSELKVVENLSELTIPPKYGDNVLGGEQICIPNATPETMKQFDMARDTKGEWPSIRDGLKKLIFYGVVRYRDLFDVSVIKETAFCYVYIPKIGGMRLGGPPEYNKAT
jgi:hypothetical protein